MITTEITIEDDVVFCNGHEIEISVHEDYDKFYVVGRETFSYLEQAIKYCMEN